MTTPQRTGPDASILKATLIRGRRAFLLFFAVLAAVLVAACGPLVEFPGSGEAASLYALSPVRDINPRATFDDVILMVEEPKTSAVFDDRGIALTPENREVRYYAGAQWVDRTPRMVQNLLITTFEETGAFRDVGSASMSLAADYRLDTAIRSWRADYTGDNGNDRASDRTKDAPTIRIEMTARLFSSGPLTLLDRRTVAVDEPVRSNRMNDIIAAFDRASIRATTTLVEWSIDTIADKEGADEEE